VHTFETSHYQNYAANQKDQYHTTND